MEITAKMKDIIKHNIVDHNEFWIVEQLKANGCTQEEAEYAINWYKEQPNALKFSWNAYCKNITENKKLAYRYLMRVRNFQMLIGSGWQTIS